MNEQELQAALAAIAKGKEAGKADLAMMTDAAKKIYDYCSELGSSLGIECYIHAEGNYFLGIAFTDLGSRRNWALGRYYKYEFNPGYRWITDFDKFDAPMLIEAFQLFPTFIRRWNEKIQEERGKREEAARIAKLAEAAFSELLEKLKE
jgi:hypothetical protein